MAVFVLLLAQFPGFIDGTMVPSEADIIGLEGSARRWFFGGLRAGHITTLAPTAHLGVPLLGAPIYGLLYPVNWLWMILPWPLALAAGWHLNALLFVAGWMLCLRRCGHDAAVAWGAPLMVLASGPVWSFHAVSSLELPSLSFLGWTAWAGIVWLETRRPIAAIGMGVFASLGFLAGDPFVLPLAFVAAALLAFDVTAAKRLGAASSGLKVWVIGGLLAGTTALLASLPLLVEALRHYPLSERAAGISRYEALSFSTPPARWLELFSSAFSLTNQGIRNITAGEMGTNFWMPSLTLGFVAVLVWLVGARVWARRGPTGWMVILIPTAVALLTLGRWSPMTTWIWDALPPLTEMRFPERLWRYAVVTSVPILAAGLTALSAVNLTKWKVLPSKLAQSAIHSRGARVVVVVAASVLEVTMQLPAPEFASATEIEDIPPEFEALVPSAKRGEIRIAVDHRTDYARKKARFDTRVWGLPMLRPTEASAGSMLKYFPPEYLPDVWGYRWLGVSHLIAPNGSASDEASIAESLRLGPPKRLGDTGYKLAPIEASSPRLGLVFHRVRVAKVLEGIENFDEGVPAGNFRGFRAALERGEMLIDPEWSLDEDGRLTPLAPLWKTQHASNEAELECDEPTQILLQVDPYLEKIHAEVQTPCAGVLSVPWRFLRGWHAELNGRPTTVVAVGAVTLGVAVPAGRSVVDFSWRPAAVPWLLLISLLTMVGAAMGALLHAASRRRQRQRARAQ